MLRPILEFVPMSQFAYAWRFEGARGAESPSDSLAPIRPLSLNSGREICESGRVFRCQGPPHVNTDCYHVVSDCSLAGYADGGNNQVSRWMVPLPIGAGADVFVSWNNGAALITKWEVFRATWATMWYPFDVMDVFDRSLKWAVLLGPEEHSVYVELGPADSESPHFDWDAGFRLVRTVSPA
jgi:hypothetical protein